MKNVILFVSVCALLSGTIIWNNVNSTTKPIKMDEDKEDIVFTDINDDVDIRLKYSLSPVEKEANNNRPSREKMIEEVISFWNLWFDNEGASETHERRAKFPEYAVHLVDAVRFFQENETNMGGKLPNDKDAHLIVASMTILETGIKPKLIGSSRGEVGLIQIHGAALHGHKKKEVISNPGLGLLLGVRWLAYHTQFCNSKKEGIDNWTQVLSLYGAGIRGGRNSNGTCKEITMAKKRVNLAKFYRNKIRYGMDT